MKGEKDRQGEEETGRGRERERQEAAYVLGLKPHVSLTPYHWPSKPSKGLPLPTHTHTHTMHNLQHVQGKIFFINESLQPERRRAFRR